MLDILVDIALERMTDFLQFEKIATDVMNKLGYRDIVPLGGYKDKGQDGFLEKFFEGKLRERIVFQYSLSSNSQTKITKTIEKLEANRISLTSLVYVTNQKVSVTSRSSMQCDALAKSITLVIHDGVEIAAGLRDNDFKMFHNYFPNPKQILSTDPLILSGSISDAHEKELLKACLAFVVSEKGNQARGNAYMSLTQAALCAMGEAGGTKEEVITFYSDKYNIKDVDFNSVEKALYALCRSKFATYEGKTYMAAEEQRQAYVAKIAEINSKIEYFTKEIAASAVRDFPKTIDDTTYSKYIRNSQRALVKVLQAHGLDVIGKVSNNGSAGFHLTGIESVITDACRENLSHETGNILIAAFSQALKNPSEEMVDALFQLAIAFASTYSLGVEPNLRDLQVSRLAGKTIFLDTDFILDCIVPDNPDTEANRKMIKTLISHGVKIQIPVECIDECVTHSRLSHNTITYFGQSLSSVPEDTANASIHNVFARGYYHYIRRNGVRMPFKDYINNYFDSNNPSAFMERLVKDIFGNEPKIVNITNAYNLTNESTGYADAYAVIRECVEHSRKSMYRSPADVDALAETDTKLFLAAESLNAAVGQPGILAATSMILTRSGAFDLAARKIGKSYKLATTPQALSTFFEMAGVNCLDKHTVVDFIFNPVVNFAAQMHKDDIVKLARLGYDLSNANITRLNFDIDHSLHKLLEGFSDETVKDEQSFKAFLDSNAFTKLSTVATGVGYKLSLQVKHFMSKVENAELVISDLKKTVETQSKAIKQFASKETVKERRRLKHLKRTARLGKQSK
jgi:hypothetical protein